MDLLLLASTPVILGWVALGVTSYYEQKEIREQKAAGTYKEPPEDNWGSSMSLDGEPDLTTLGSGTDHGWDITSGW